MTTLPLLAAALLAASPPSPAPEQAPLGPGGPRLPEGMPVADYNQAGIHILHGVGELKDAFKKADPVRLSTVFHPDFDDAQLVREWRRVPIHEQDGVVLSRIELGEPLAERGESLAAIIEQFRAFRARYEDLETVRFKLGELHRIRRDHSADARIRFEVIGTDADGRRITDRGYWETRWKPMQLAHGEEGLALVRLELSEGDTAEGPGDLFPEVAKDRGISFYGHPDPRFVPPNKDLRFQIVRHALGGVATGDIDGDGDDDLLFVGGHEAKLYVNDGRGHFEDGTAAAGLAGVDKANAAVFADFDNDGDADLYVARFYGDNFLFANNGQGVFTNVIAGSGLEHDDAVAVLAAGDLDGDGNLDLYLGRFLDAKTTIPTMVHYARNAERNRVYFGSGDLKFRDVSAASGADDPGLTLGVAIADYDRDGDQDIYLSNDFGRNVLFENDGSGTFTDVAKQANALAISGGMSASWGDWNGDGWLDMYVSSVRSNQRWFSQDVNIRGYILRIVESNRRPMLQELFVDLKKHLGHGWDQLGQVALSGNYLLQNNGDGTFSDVSDDSGARPHGWYWSSGFFDLDNDGDLDVIAANGFVSGKEKHDL